MNSLSISLKGTHILLGVTGGIAAYKSAELCRLFSRAGATVQVVMSEAACEFITPLTMEALSGNPVPVHMFGRTRGALEHIDIPTEADIMVIAPATADYLARCATGRASDLISSVTLAFDGPIVAAPAMNTKMYTNPATQRNLHTLAESHGWQFVEPDEGELACGTTGKGRMADPAVIFETVQRFSQKDLADQKIIVTAGPTVEDIDPVRYLSNRSSGKTGYAIAARAVARGADVTLISGPVSIDPPAGCQTINVRSAIDMEAAVYAHSDTADAIVMCAAVADYRPDTVSAQKIKKPNLKSIQLIPNPDILAGLGKKYQGKAKPRLIGFALETENLKENATKKLQQKGAYAIVSNLAQDALEHDQTRVAIFFASGETVATEVVPKTALANIVLDLICQ